MGLGFPRAQLFTKCLSKAEAADLCHRADAKLLRMICGRTCN